MLGEQRALQLVYAGAFMHELVGLFILAPRFGGRRRDLDRNRASSSSRCCCSSSPSADWVFTRSSGGGPPINRSSEILNGFGIELV